MNELSTQQLHLGSGFLSATGNYLYINGSLISGKPSLFSKSITVDLPVSGDNITLFKTDEGINVNKMWAVLRGNSPTLTYTVKFDTGRHTNGIELVTNGIAINSITSGNLTNSFNNSSISGNCWVWVEVTATGGGSLSGFHNTIFYTHQ